MQNVRVIIWVISWHLAETPVMQSKNYVEELQHGGRMYVCDLSLVGLIFAPR